MIGNWGVIANKTINVKNCCMKTLLKLTIVNVKVNQSQWRVLELTSI